MMSLAATSTLALHPTPKWTPTYNMTLSTAHMPCNYSGMYDAREAARWGIADFDWSNAKLLWANDKPMNSEALLIQQAEAVKAANPHTRVFVYRNLVKALPWFGSVRAKLENPAYSGWFLTFKPGSNYSSPPCTGALCSMLYHDQDQTPSTSPDADGRCFEACDCGSLPCGEYLWDHRNESLRRWLLDEYLFGPSALGHSGIDGLFLDDGWVDTTQPNPWWGPPEGFCASGPFGGPTEVFPNCTHDMGLSQADVSAITAGWRTTAAQAYEKALSTGKWVWQLFETVGSPPRDRGGCVRYFQEACAPNSTMQTAATFFGLSGPKTKPLPSVHQDVASFLLVRGPFSWLGYQWLGCVSCKRTPTDPSGLCDPTGRYERPGALDIDYGEPLGLCAESSAGSAIFEREWSKARVSFDCGSWSGSIVPHGNGDE